MAGQVVVLDRHPGICCLLAAALDAQSNVIWTSSEYETLREVSRNAPDVLVLDVSVSGVHWADLLQTIRMKAMRCEIIAVIPAGQLVLLQQFTRMGVDAIFERGRELGGLLRRASERVALDAQTPLPWRACNQHVDRALEYLGRHFLETVTVQQVAAAIGVSVSHLAHVFGAAAGMTIKEYALRLKVELTKRLLVSGAATLEQLAEQCGFCDASHLSRVFRQFAGCWPGEFRASRRDVQQLRTSVH
jgi:AraC-like DNA-binding protein/CheY-like chemotaxis protein